MLKIKIHPYFIVLAAVMCLLGKAYAFFCVLLAALMHEGAHALAAENQGYTPSSVTLMPHGAVLNSTDKLDKNSEVIIAAAGPAVSLLLAALTMAFWWLLPSVFPYTQPFYSANLTLGLFNLLPVYPLDGARIVLGLTKNRIKALGVLKYAGIGLSFTLMALFLATAFSEINYTLGTMSVFLFAGAVAGTNADMYTHILSNSLLSKAYPEGVREETLLVSETVSLRRLLKQVNGKTVKIFKVLDGNLNVVAVLTESELLDLFAANDPAVGLKAALKTSSNHSK